MLSFIHSFFIYSFKAHHHHVYGMEHSHKKKIKTWQSNHQQKYYLNKGGAFSGSLLIILFSSVQQEAPWTALS